MTNDKDLKPLIDWLDKSQKEVEEFLKKVDRDKARDRNTLKNGFYQNASNIKKDISRRDSYFKFYKQKTESELSEKQKNIEFQHFRNSLFIYLLILNTRIYEKCVQLCYFIIHLNNSNRCYPSWILSNKLSEILKIKTKAHLDTLRKLKKEYGYYLSIILFLRNQFIHRGEVFNEKEENIFIPNDLDTLNLKAIKENYDKYMEQKYKYTYFSKKDFDLERRYIKRGKDVIGICMKNSDHYMGQLINKILQIKQMDGSLLKSLN